MDAREKWMTQLAELCFAFYDTYQSGLSERAAALDAIQAHARTTPEGFALVPVPEWVPVGERLPVVPDGAESVAIWEWEECCSAPWVREFTKNSRITSDYWMYVAIPAPPKSESL